MASPPSDRPLAIRHTLPDHLRHHLAAVWGDLHDTTSLKAALAGSEPVIAIGDVVTRTCIEEGIPLRLAAIDGHTHRGSKDPGHVEDPAKVLARHFDRVVRVVNPPATVTQEAWDAVAQAAADAGLGSTLLLVDGEEDLLALPAFRLAPPGTKILYGMPSRGAVLVRTDDALRQRVQHLLDQMPAG